MNRTNNFTIFPSINPKNFRNIIKTNRDKNKKKKTSKNWFNE